MSPPLVSIIINNHNYSTFVADAINSALAQSYASLEVIVVDDGSTDRSRDVIATFGSRVNAVDKANGGQASALNEGVRVSRGELLFFLDADDCFDSMKVATILAAVGRDRLSEPLFVWHMLRAIDARGTPLDFQLPAKRRRPWPSNFYEYAKRVRHVPFASSPTSGIALTRALATRIFPIPEREARTSADDFVVRAALLLGQSVHVPDTLGSYRVHDRNNWYGNQKAKSRSFLESLDQYLNERLVANGRKPVIDYWTSMYARETYLSQRNARALLRLALLVPFRSRGLEEMRFAAKTLMMAAAVAYRQRLRTH